MRPMPLLLLPLLLPTAALAQGARISEVLVFPGGAEVQRVLTVAAGTQEAQFACIPARIQLDALQACVLRNDVPGMRALLQTLVPPRTVREWAFTGEPFSAAEARAAGLVNHVVPAAELDAKVQWLVDRIADKSPTAIRRGKAAMRALASMSFDEAIAYTEAQIGLLTLTEDAREGLAAFNAKRRPVWTGR